MQIVTTEINSLKEMFDKLVKYDDNWVFRGQSDGNWGLTRSIERIEKRGFDGTILRAHETYSRLKFEAVAHHYLQSQNLPTTNFSWISMMQHHGIPTRLIDLTTMPFIGLFFAIDGIKLDEISDGDGKTSAIWCIPHRVINRTSLSKLRETKPTSKNDFHSEFDENCDKFFNDYIDSECHNLFWITEPRNLNLRLRQQGGTFLIADNLNKPMMELISEDDEYDCQIDKLIFPHSIVTEIYAGLNKMHINHEQIYPGLDSVARDIAIELLYKISSA